MATWDDTTFSTSTSIAKIEAEINNLTATNWDNKIATAKTLMSNDVQEVLVNRGLDYWTDFENDEKLLDVVTNKSIFNIVSDYKTLQLIYMDLANGVEDSVYGAKMTQYGQMYKSLFDQAMKYIDLDLDQDGTTDVYKANLHAIGRSTRR